MTSNIGSDLIREDRTLGFPKKNDDLAASSYDRMKTNVLDEIKRFFRPEFLNRIDGTVVFHPLNLEHMAHIVDLNLEDVSAGLIEKGINLEVTDQTKQWLGKKGYDPTFGARPVRRLIQDQIEDKLSDAILDGTLNPGDTAVVDYPFTTLTPNLGVVDLSDDGDVYVKAESPIPPASV